VLFKTGYARTPAQLHLTRGGCFGVELVYALHQKAFYVELLDVGEGWLQGELEVFLLAQVEGIDLVGSREGATHAPLNALARDAFKHAEPVENFE